MLTLDNKWTSCAAEDFGGRLSLENATDLIEGGMSGSPILNGDGAAIGVVCLGGDEGFGGSHPRLEHDLPGWLVRGSRFRRASSQG